MEDSTVAQGLDQLYRLKEAIKDIAKNPYVATSSDGLIKVSAVASGQVVDININPRVYRNPDSVGLASTILQTLNQAIAGATAMQLESLERASGGLAGSFQELLQSAAAVAEELMDEADDMWRQE
ncbi:hypothetical protein DPM19_30300 [Actinomadura craniellae]|uniref:YbaB/EbfC family DNA-binding protein n=1 Tax=Actinomadura craniellae TaxID=2231787 RepID=A0A365GWW6_9ACTN|nr:YbaB/EbfC family nucleoid-associated protein [Actinomadura craniellae]RAY11319.1 hypothetical protein DPM19_30300 [Actinomadura craniellae]